MGCRGLNTVMFTRQGRKGLNTVMFTGRGCRGLNSVMFTGRLVEVTVNPQGREKCKEHFVVIFYSTTFLLVLYIGM